MLRACRIKLIRAAIAHLPINDHEVSIVGRYVGQAA
jgi:hypothetical protein